MKKATEDIRMGQAENLGKPLEVHLFKEFEIVYREDSLNEEKIKSVMLTRLLVYIILNHTSNITAQELCDTLWQDDTTDNPQGALKNLMYRLRSMLKKIWPEEEFIITGRGSYMWNPEIALQIDCEDFESYWKGLQKETDTVERAVQLEKMVPLYRGSLLPKMASEYWITSLSTYYHSMYLTAVKELALFLENTSQYSKLEEISKNAINVDNLDETLHCWFIKALIGQNKHKLAIEQYQKAKGILYENLGVQPSEELRGIYEELLKENNEEQLDLGEIQADLKREDAGERAFFCEYGVFKKSYQLEVRRASRLGMSIFLTLITVHPIVELKKDSDTYMKLINSSMEVLQEVLLDSLRTGDIVSRYSTAQFIIMLPVCQFESAKMVMERVQSRFYKACKKKVRMRYSVEELAV